MKNHKLCYIVEETSKTKKTRIKRQANKQEIHVFIRCKFYIVSLPHTVFFANHTNICCSVSASLPEQVLHFLDVGAHSATVASLSVCSLLFGVPSSVLC